MQNKKTQKYIKYDIILSNMKKGSLELYPEKDIIARLSIYEPNQDKDKICGGNNAN